jgi:hypothetical protein
MARDNMRSTLKARLIDHTAWGKTYTMKNNIKK